MDDMFMMIGGYELYMYSLQPIDSNMYVLINDLDALVIDPHENEEMMELLKEKKCKNMTIVLTHEHFDHICGVNALREYARSIDGLCTVYAQKQCADVLDKSEDNLAKFFMALLISRSEEERELALRVFDQDYTCSADVSFEDNYVLNWGDISMMIKSTPGHSPGSVCIEFYNKDQNLEAVATGDSLILDTPVITRLPRGNKSDYREITRPYLKSIPADTMILPGHGDMSVLGDFEF